MSEVKTVLCPPHAKVFAGGAEVSTPSISITLSAPNASIDGWSAQLVNLSPSVDAYPSLLVYAICVPRSA